MLRTAILVGVIALAITAAAAPRTGKVVRVERQANGPKGTPRHCDVRDDGLGPQGTCIGPQPAIGAIVQVTDDTKVFAEIEITDVQPYGNCKSAWLIKGSMRRGDLTPMASGRAIGLIDAALDPRTSHRLPDDLTMGSPAGRVDEAVLVAIDREGKGQAALVITQYTCDPAGQPNGMGTAQCYDVYHRSGVRMTRVQQSILTCF